VQIDAWKVLLEGAETVPPRSVDPTLTDVFAPLTRARAQDRRCVVGQLGLSLDGRIATETGDSKYINGQDALTHLHRIRALVDAVIIGAGTASADDPRLDVRMCEGRDPARVVIDPNGRVGPEALLWRNDGCRRIVFGGHPDLPPEIERVPVPPGDIAAAALVERLHALGLDRLLVEGGANTLGRFLSDGQIDCLHLLYGRVIIGSGKPGLDLPPISRLSEAMRPASITHVFPDGDLLVACDLRSERR
jgi:diaminohydroxyphosphoribosylaminopyrimidine deaminase/5-amino-6-(5-phosphoribosylamino)uracil reductase